jgi:hypothetical protein
MLDFFKFVLDGNLQLKNLVGIVGVLNRLGYLLGLCVHSSLEQGLCVVQLVLVIIWKELGELVVHVRGIAVVLDLEVAVSKEGQSSSVSGLELKLVVEDVDDLNK